MVLLVRLALFDDHAVRRLGVFICVVISGRAVEDRAPHAERSDAADVVRADGRTDVKNVPEGFATV